MGFDVRVVLFGGTSVWMVRRMGYGRLLVVTGVLVACLLGCAAHRSGSASDSRRTEEQALYDRLYARTDAKVSASSTITDRWRNLRITRRDYDLDKPEDGKGMYPVKSETVLEGEERQKEDQEMGETELSDSREAVSGETVSRVSRDTGSTTDTTLKAGTQPLWWWLAGMLSAIMSLIFLWWKYGKKNQTK